MSNENFAADDTGSNMTVDDVIPDNVNNAANFFQNNPSGLPPMQLGFQPEESPHNQENRDFAKN